jgi:tight adherence protein B
MSTAGLVAFISVLAFGAAWLIVPAATTPLRRLGVDSQRASTWPWTRFGLGAAFGWLAWQLLSRQGWAVLVLAFGAAGAAAVGQRLITGWRLRQASGRRQAACVELCDALAAELDGGLPASTAFERACAPWAELTGVVLAVRLGDDVGLALRRAAELPGADGLRAVAAAWDVAARSGAAPATVLSRVAAGLRSDADARAEVTAALSPPRATAKLLAALPIFGVGLGVSMGAQPVQFLLHTGAGALCLTLGAALALLGMWWVERLAAAAEI